jgi:hypothetical protein
MQAGAATGARRQIEATGRAMRADAAQMGRGLSSAQATAIQTGTQAGGAAVGAAGQGVTFNQAGANMMGQGYNTAVGANQSAGNLYGQQAKIQGDAAAANTAAIGSVAGAVMMSSEDYKDSGPEVSDEAALEAIKRMPANKAWKYKPRMGMSSAEHVGPYAEDVQEELGEDVAPGGRMIDMRKMSAANTAAISALAKRVQQLSNELAA